jgi:sterol desaturase/sphingolipid hydroxylase (fatty acid hydroxylase superfamily)
MDPRQSLIYFLAAAALLAAAETLFPRRAFTQPRLRRDTINLLLSGLSNIFLLLLLPAAAVRAAVTAGEKGWGLLNLLSLPVWAEAALALLLLDMVIYFQHRFFHRNRLLWRLHRVHHIDGDLDFSTGVRFHPLEILLSMLIKVAAVYLIGPAAAVVAAFELLLLGNSLFNHSNLAIPAAADRLLRLFVVTPDFHRVHHSVLREETDSNFGFWLPWWDRLFGTYVPQPRTGHTAMALGLREFPARDWLSLPRLLVMPFRAYGRRD